MPFLTWVMNQLRKMKPAEVAEPALAVHQNLSMLHLQCQALTLSQPLVYPEGGRRKKSSAKDTKGHAGQAYGASPGATGQDIYSGGDVRDMDQPVCVHPWSYAR